MLRVFAVLLLCGVALADEKNHIQKIADSITDDYNSGNFEGLKKHWATNAAMYGVTGCGAKSTGNDAVPGNFKNLHDNFGIETLENVDLYVKSFTSGADKWTVSVGIWQGLDANQIVLRSMRGISLWKKQPGTTGQWLAEVTSLNFCNP